MVRYVTELSVRIVFTSGRVCTVQCSAHGEIIIWSWWEIYGTVLVSVLEYASVGRFLGV